MNSSLCVSQMRRISQAALEKLKFIPQQNLIWRANEDNPRKHNQNHEGLFYNLPDEKQIQQMFGHPSPFDPETTAYYKILGKNPIMIRKPALDTIEYIKKLDSSLPNIRVLLYGDKGHGKTHTLTHLVHYLQTEQQYFILHVREMKKFTRSPGPKESYVDSTSRPGRIDTPLNAAVLLQQFRVQNANLIEKYKDALTCGQDYVWSSREVTKAGEPLINVAEHGVNRVNHASDCVAVLLKELTLAADAGKIKLASILDNVRFLFLREAGVIMHKDNKLILVDEMTVARALKKLIKGSYKNGLVIATCDNKLSSEQNQTPREVLGIEGWNHFDPCLPIHVPKYSRKEFESCMNFYQDIEWLCRPESRTQEVRDEVQFLSGLNPGQVAYICSAL